MSGGTGSISLTAKETEMIIAVIQQMGEIPKNLDFDIIAKAVGQKYAKNAKSSCKKLFDRLINAYEAQVEANNGATAGSDVELNDVGANDMSDEVKGYDGPVKKKTRAKRGVGKQTAPKKVTATKAKPTAKTAATKPAARGRGRAKVVLAEDVIEEEEEEEEEVVEEEAKDEVTQEQGKSNPLCPYPTPKSSF